jgi:hypothetical protein
MARKKISLRERASRWAENSFAPQGSSFEWARVAFEQGYRAAKRDMRKAFKWSALVFRAIYSWSRRDCLARRNRGGL